MPPNYIDDTNPNRVWKAGNLPKYVVCKCTRRFNIKSVQKCPYCGTARKK